MVATAHSLSEDSIDLARASMFETRSEIEMFTKSRRGVSTLYHSLAIHQLELTLDNTLMIATALQ